MSLCGSGGMFDDGAVRTRGIDAVLLFGQTVPTLHYRHQPWVSGLPVPVLPLFGLWVLVMDRSPSMPPLYFDRYYTAYAPLAQIYVYICSAAVAKSVHSVKIMLMTKRGEARCRAERSYVTAVAVTPRGTGRN